MTAKDIEVATELLIYMRKFGLGMEEILSALTTAECMTLAASVTGIPYRNAAIIMHSHHENAANDLSVFYKHQYNKETKQ